MFRKDNSNRQGGVAILCRNHIKCSEIPTISTDRIQTFTIKVQTIYCLFTVLSVYCPPRNDRFPISVLTNILCSLPAPILVMRDFNARHAAFGSGNIKSRGTQILDLLDDLNMFILNIGASTTVNRPNETVSAIDIAFSSPNLAPSAEWSVYSACPSRTHKLENHLQNQYTNNTPQMK